ncbi:MAG: ABC transporter substrate-binding protein [Nocardioides sp.]
MAHTSVRLAAMALAGALGLTACSGGSDGPGTSELTTSDVVDTTPAGTEPVDSIVWGLPTGEPTSIDPIVSGATSEMTVSPNLCENLLRVEPDFSIQPAVASFADWVDDTTFVIDLRDDVTFWDGTALTAEDVVYSLERTADRKGPSFWSEGFRYVTSIEKTGPLQVTLEFSQPDAQFRNGLAGPAGGVVQAAFASKVGRAFGTAQGGVMCTGPYEFVGWTTGDSIEVKANPDYWDGPPNVGAITFQFISDAATLTTALRAGEIDGAYDLPVSTAVALEKADSGTVYRGNSTQSLSFGPTSSKGFGADPKVREALNLAIDKEGLIATVLRGLGTIQRTFTAPLAWSGDAEAEIYQEGYDALPANAEPDLDRAKELVAEAGADGATLVMAIPAGGATESQAATVVQAAAKEIGIDLQLKTMQPTEFSELFYIPEKRAGVDFVCTIGFQEVPGSLYYAPEFATPTGLYNWSGYDRPEVTKLLDEARASADQAVTAEKFVEAQAIFAPDNLQVTLAGMNTLLYLGDGLSGSPASIAYISSPWAAELGGTE